MTRRQSYLIGMSVSAASGVLIAASMLNFDVSFLGWVALVPLLLAIEMLPKVSPIFIAMPFGLIWSIAVHNWYPNMFGPVECSGIDDCYLSRRVWCCDNTKTTARDL